MKKFTNQNVKKEKNRLNRNIILNIVILIIGLGFGLWAYYKIDFARKNIKPLNEIILETDEDKENKIATINVNYVPYQFAVQDGNENSYYIVNDERYMYIAYLPDYKFNELNREDIKENPIEIKGRTRLISQEIKELAIQAFNEAVEEEKRITIADFDDYFGTVYLESTATYEDNVAEIQGMFFFIFTIGGLIGLAITIRQRVKFGNSLKNMDEYEIEKIDNEMNDKEAFYYEKTHLYLTNNYIVNFQGTFKILEYKDVIWMYAKVYRINGIKSGQSITVVDKKGKGYEIAQLDIVTKAKKEIYDEIWNTIISKNKNIILGYTKEAQEKAKEMVEKE